MKIKKITNIGEMPIMQDGVEINTECICVEIEEYPHAQPVFRSDLTKAELETKLAAWKIEQDAVDAENANRPTVAEPEVSAELKELEGQNS